MTYVSQDKLYTNRLRVTQKYYEYKFFIGKIHRCDHTSVIIDTEQSPII